MADPRYIPVIAGPTGSGKTGLAVELAGEFPVEIVSADSRQIIRGLDIGTAKPTPEEQRLARFHLVDIVEPGVTYSAFQFIDDATAAIRDVLSRGRLPLVVGGTGLYLRALDEGVIEIEQDPQVRARLEQEMEQSGPRALFERLEQIDPDEASRLHPNNRVRLIRALEIYELTGKTRSELAASGVYKKSGFEFSYFCLIPPRDELYARINRRVDEMIGRGLLDEVRAIFEQGRTEPVRRSNVIGYNELLDHLEGRISLDDAIAGIKQNHRRYAKRQLTWFRHQVDCRSFDEARVMRDTLALELRRLMG